MATRAKRLTRGPKARADYDAMAIKAKKLEPGSYFTAATCDDDPSAVRTRNQIAWAINRRVKMPEGLKLSFSRTNQFSVQVHCERITS